MVSTGGVKQIAHSVPRFTSARHAAFVATRPRNSSLAGALPIRKSTNHWRFVVSTSRFVASRKKVKALSAGATSGRSAANSDSSGGGASRLATAMKTTKPPIATTPTTANPSRNFFMPDSLAFAASPGNAPAGPSGPV